MANATVKLYLNKWAYVKQDSPSIVVDITGQERLKLSRNATSGILQYAYLGFNSMPSNLKRRRLYSVSALFRIKGPDNVGNSTRGFLNVSAANFNPSTLVWTNRPGEGGNGFRLISESTYTLKDCIFSIDGDTVSDADRSKLAALFLKSGAGYSYAAYENGDIVGAAHDCYIYNTLEGGGLPYLEITYDNSISVKSKIALRSGPTGGYADPRNNTTFSWAFVKDDTYSCADENFGQSSATLYWKESTAENYTAVSASGSTQSVTIPANTFPTKKTIQWYVQGTDDGGTTSQTPVYSFSTTAPLVIATPISPINTIEDGSTPIKLRWEYSSADGRLPTRYALHWKLQGESTWNTLYNPGAGVVDTEYDVPADTFPAGTIVWGVQAANVDGAWGTTGSASFVCRAAPVLSGVTSDETPFLTVQWQTDGQLAYEVTVDGTVYGPYFGAEKSFQLPDYLKDGTYQVQVRVMGAWNLWSNIESIQVTIANEAGESILLNAYGGIDNSVTWQTEEETADFLIYRNGKMIGHTREYTWEDKFAENEANYQVVNRLSDGNYSISNDATATFTPDAVYMAELTGRDWLKIELGLEDRKDPEYEYTLETAYEHLSGDVFPSVIMSEYREQSMDFSALFLAEQEEDDRRFRSLFGKPVVMKMRDGTVFVGVLDKVRRMIKKRFWTAYSFTLRRITWEDYRDDTQ
jgi:hypothetical protein